MLLAKIVRLGISIRPRDGELLFDEDVIDRLQTKQVLGIGVSYALLEVAP